jgi:hypothetical protein
MMSLPSVALAVLLGAAPAAAADADRWDARLTAATGEVAVYPAGGSEAVEASADMPLDEGDRVVTSAGATAEISLDGESLITLQEGTDFTLEKTAKSESTFSLALGSLLAKIQTLGSARLSVRTPTSVAAVRGTEFGVDVEDGEQSHVGVFDEGRVEVSGSGATEVLTPNQETTVARGRAPLKAFALKRFAARRALMRGRIRRLQAVRKAWRSLPPGPRRQMRLKALNRRLKRIRRRKENVERRERLLKDREGRRAPPAHGDRP